MTRADSRPDASSASAGAAMAGASANGPLRVVLAGWYGAANLGDELLLAVIAGWVREAGGVPIAISTHPEATRAAHGIEAVGYGDLAAIVEAVAGADLFVLGGGGLFQDYDAFDTASLNRFPSYNVSQYAQFLLLADELGLPTLALAQGVGPLRGAEGRAIAADVFTRAGGVSVRDQDSLALVREIGVTRDVSVAPDPGWTWRCNPGPALSSRYPALGGRRVIAMILRDWPFDPAWESACADALRSSIPDGWAVLWLDFNRPPGGAQRGYSEIARRMVATLADARTHVIWEGERLEDAAALVAQCDACIAMRLHGVLLASAAGLPVIAIEYDGKVAALCEEIAIPPRQRVRMAAIGGELPAAIAAITGAEPPARLEPVLAARLRDGALVHRDLLWRAMATARDALLHPAPREHSWLARWLVHAPEATPRCVAALTARLRRQAGPQAGIQGDTAVRP